VGSNKHATKIGVVATRTAQEFAFEGAVVQGMRRSGAVVWGDVGMRAADTDSKEEPHGTQR
jgi:hypothetical protein